MDPFLTDIIRTIRQINGFEKAFIAGGSIRDSMFSKSFKDIDIFVPVTNERDLTNKIELGMLRQSDSMFKNPQYTQEYKRNSKLFCGQVEFKILGMELDICGVRIPEDNMQKDIIEKTLDAFNCDINKIAYDGYSLTVTNEFNQDFKNKTCTLVNLLDLNQLPKQVMKMNSMSIRLGIKPVFDQVLTLTKQSKAKPSTKEKVKSKELVFEEAIADAEDTVMFLETFDTMANVPTTGER
jgi:hypothetical protein